MGHVLMIMGAVMLVVCAGLAIAQVMERAHLERVDGIVIQLQPMNGTSQCRPLVQMTVNQQTVERTAMPVNQMAMSGLVGKKVDVYVKNLKEIDVHRWKCYVDTGKPGALPGLARVMMPMVIFLIVGVMMIALGSKIPL